jgi:hypothetical protein
MTTNGKKRLNLYQKNKRNNPATGTGNDKLTKLRESLNNMRGISVAEGVGAAALRSFAGKINKVIPITGSKKD